MNNTELTAERLNELLHYDPLTGVFTWKLRVSNQIQIGTVAGGVDKRGGYHRIRLDGKLYKRSRLAYLTMTGSWPPEQVDHVNHIRNDDRWCNLVAVSHTDNARNQSKRIDNTSGDTGICWHKAKGKWHAQIRAGNKRIHLGIYEDYHDAFLARWFAERENGFHENHGLQRAA